jgi:hypothetical protein
MKKLRNLILILSLVTIPALSLLADNPSPPPPGGDPGSNGGTPVGAPIDGGVFILLAMGAAYGTAKARRRQGKEE